MAAGDGLTPRQQERIEQAVESAREENGLDLSVLVGDLELDDLSQFRAAAERLHAALGERSASAVLVVVAPGQRRLEIVTGPAVRRRVPDRVTALAVLSMTSAFRGGDLTGGRTIAGTGTIDADGKVGAVGGVALKTQAARRDGASVFLVPKAECSDARSELPEGLRLVPVTSLTDAVNALRALNRGEPAPSC